MTLAKIFDFSLYEYLYHVCEDTLDNGLDIYHYGNMAYSAYSNEYWETYGYYAGISFSLMFLDRLSWELEELEAELELSETESEAVESEDEDIADSSDWKKISVEDLDTNDDGYVSWSEFKETDTTYAERELGGEDGLDACMSAVF